MTDGEIIRQILQGKQDLFRVIIERYQTMVFRTCLGFVHDQDDADDLTQDVFIQAYRSLSGFKGNSAFSTWIYRITVNACLNKKRKNLKGLFSRLLSQEQTSGFPLSDSEDPEYLLIKDEQRKIVQEALDGLPKNQHIALILSKYDDLSQKEIAGIMEITEGAVEALLQRAKANLRKKLVRHFGINENDRRKK